jgi:hypothetical protein
MFDYMFYCRFDCLDWVWLFKRVTQLVTCSPRLLILLHTSTCLLPVVCDIICFPFLLGAIALGYANIFVTAPSPENLRTLFEFVFKGLDACGYQEHIDYDLVESTNPDWGRAVVRVNVFRAHRQVKVSNSIIVSAVILCYVKLCCWLESVLLL